MQIMNAAEERKLLHLLLTADLELRGPCSSHAWHNTIPAVLQILNAAEEREKKLVALEEEMARRRRDLEHDHTTRLAEAEATVRRLQVCRLLAESLSNCLLTMACLAWLA